MLSVGADATFPHAFMTEHVQLVVSGPTAVPKEWASHHSAQRRKSVVHNYFEESCDDHGG
jgi:hypothetical protein